MIGRALVLFVLLVTSAAAPAQSQELAPEDLEHFESKIRPVLVERCYQCHGADPERIRAGLALVDAEGLRAGGDSGAVIVPGAPDDSLLVEVLRYEGPIQMPPDGRLPAAVVADFERWITLGAPDPRATDTPVVAARSDSGGAYDFGPGREHWAYRSMARAEPPAVENEAWVRGPIDRFILARLEADGLAPVGPATKRQLLRRITFDLTGLPPTPAEIDAFLADTRPDAYERVVDRLLASPRYGERWGRHWLDVARYADSNGLDENVAHRNAFRYRDWVIEAFNRDQPYDRFVQEQIAGDLLPGGTDEERFARLTATGFLAMGAKVLAEQDVDKMLIDIVDEQVNVVGRAFLAEPVGCARCHDHKFDPIPTADYYALAGIMRSTKTMGGEGSRWVERPLVAEATVEAYEAAQEEVETAQDAVDAVVEARNEILRRPRRAALAGYLLAAEEAYPGWSDDEQANRVALSEVARIAERDGLEAAVLERWVRAFYRYREGPPVQGDGPNPSVVFEIWDAYVAADPSTYGQVTDELRALIASEKVLIAPLTRSLVRGPAPTSLAEVAWRYASLFAVIEIAWDEHLQRLGLEDEEDLSPRDFRLPREQEELRRLVYGGGLCILCLPQTDEEEQYPADVAAELVRLRAIVEEREAAAPPRPPYAMSVQEDEIVDLPVHIRGSHLNLADTPQPRGFLRVTDHLVPPPPIPEGASGRLELARWITHPEHPLTARVMANRIWHWHFGRGLVDTPSNFGASGSAPTNLALLDWLARRFIDSGWSVKTMHRDILLSSTYRLSTDYSDANAAVDQGNLLHWRMNRRRLEIEPIRDALLQLAGTLDLTMGGRVEEYNPRGYVFSEGNTFGRFDFYAAPRRSVYMPVVRNAIYAIFAGFDFGNASDSVGGRPSTVVPSQALLMMNSEFVETQAGAFAQRLLAVPARSARERV
ncbi:MAG: PSD1 and planctomycete cytochrome C domain-containing protein, partial [bacterium]